MNAPSNRGAVTLVAALIIYAVGSAFTWQSIMSAAFSEGVGASRERLNWAVGRAGAVVTGLLLLSSVVASLRADDMAAELRRILGTAFRWAIGWALPGLLIGLLLMLGKAPPMAESGRKPDELSFYAFWIPLAGVTAAACGFVVGLLFAVLMSVTFRWRRRFEERSGVLPRHVPSLLCGAAAGGIVGALAGPSGVAFLAILGSCSVALSSVISAWWTHRAARMGRTGPGAS